MNDHAFFYNLAGLVLIFIVPLLICGFITLFIKVVKLNKLVEGQRDHITLIEAKLDKKEN